MQHSKTKKQKQKQKQSEFKTKFLSPVFTSMVQILFFLLGAAKKG